MKTCGIELSSHDAIVVVLDGNRSQWVLVDVDPRKISIPDDEDAAQIRAFKDAFHAFVRHHGIDRIIIKKRAKNGKFAGGPTSFKMEGLIQLVEACDVVLTAPQTIAKVQKSCHEDVPSELKQYQTGAFYTALSGLDKT